MNVARVEFGPDFEVLEREVLFTLTPELVGYSAGDGGDDFYDVAPGDERFLMARLVDAGQGRTRTVEREGQRLNLDPRRLVLVENFFEELRQRVPID